MFFKRISVSLADPDRGVERGVRGILLFIGKTPFVCALLTKGGILFFEKAQCNIRGENAGFWGRYGSVKNPMSLARLYRPQQPREPPPARSGRERHQVQNS